MKFELNEPVVILRGGIDGFPGVSLDGIPGRVCSTHANALPGMISVWVDWSKTRYADVEGLPNVINNFPADLAPPTPPKASRAKKPTFSFSITPPNLVPDEPDEDDEKPKLRLI